MSMTEESRKAAENFIKRIHPGKRVIAITTARAMARGGKYMLVKSDDFEKMRKIAGDGDLMTITMHVQNGVLPDAGTEPKHTILDVAANAAVFEGEYSEWLTIGVDAGDRTASLTGVKAVVVGLAKMGLKDPIAMASGSTYYAIYGFETPAPVKPDFYTVMQTYFPTVQSTQYGFPVPIPGFGNTGAAQACKGVGHNNPNIPAAIVGACAPMNVSKCAWADIEGGYDLLADFPGGKIGPDGIKRVVTDDGDIIVQDTLGNVGMWGGGIMKMMDGRGKTEPEPAKVNYDTNFDDLPDFCEDGEDLVETFLTEAETPCIPSGITEYDERYGGFPTAAVSILTAKSGSGKSTLASYMCANFLKHGTKVVLFSGEMSRREVTRTLLLQLAGREGIIDDKTRTDVKTVDPDIARKIGKWIGKNFSLYDNRKSFDVDYLLGACRKECEKIGAHVLILDNEMMMNYSKAIDPVQKQKYVALEVQKLAVETGLAVILVAHPKKSNGLLDQYSVLGASELTNVAGRILSTYYIDNDFLQLYGQKYGGFKSYGKDDGAASKNEKAIAYALDGKFKDGATNAIQVLKARNCAKTRDEDTWIPLWFEAGSQRLLNRAGEQVLFGWEDDETISVYTKRRERRESCSRRELVEKVEADVDADKVDVMPDVKGD